MQNLRVKICAGDNPFSISTFVDTKVVPHIATVVKATMWQNKVLLVVMCIICVVCVFIVNFYISLLVLILCVALAMSLLWRVSCLLVAKLRLLVEKSAIFMVVSCICTGLRLIVFLQLLAPLAHSLFFLSSPPNLPKRLKFLPLSN